LTVGHVLYLVEVYNVTPSMFSNILQQSLNFFALLSHELLLVLKYFEGVEVISWQNELHLLLQYFLRLAVCERLV
jgi:hypothetical protein